MESVSDDVAEQEFGRFVEMMDLDVSPKNMDEDDREAFKQSKQRITRAIKRGSLVVDEHGQPVFTPTEGNDKTPIIFREPTGASFIAMDSKKDGHNIGKMFAAIGDMTGQHPSRFAKMAARDLKVCQAVAGLFFGG